MIDGVVGVIGRVGYVIGRVAGDFSAHVGMAEPRV